MIAFSPYISFVLENISSLSDILKLHFKSDFHHINLIAQFFFQNTKSAIFCSMSRANIIDSGLFNASCDFPYLLFRFVEKMETADDRVNIHIKQNRDSNQQKADEQNTERCESHDTVLPDIVKALSDKIPKTTELQFLRLQSLRQIRPRPR